MGVSGSRKAKTTSNETVAPSAYAQPYIDQAANANTAGFNKSMGLLDKYTPQLDQGISYFGDIANGQPQTNPFLEGILDRTRANTSDQVASQFSAAGRYGSGMFTDVLSRALADQENQLRYQDYGQQRGRMDDAALKRAGLIESVVGMPQNLSGNYAGSTGGLLGRYLTSNGTSTTKQSGGLLGGVLGSVLGNVAGRI